MPRNKHEDSARSSRSAGEQLSVKSSSKSKKKKSGDSKRSGRSTRSRATYSDDGEEDNPDLAELEQRLTDEVDDEFFRDPRKFSTLHRVIDVLGMQLTEGGGGGDGGYDPSSGSSVNQIDKNPAYRDLKDQQMVVEEAIEHLALIHCADLNGSVVQVGRVARQFHDAVTQVRTLRKQVKEIQETLGASHNDATAGTTTNSNTNSNGNTNNNNNTQDRSSAAQSAMSLRELWLKKLESEAVLALLDKLDRIRAAPRLFDSYLEQRRIGAAVTTVAKGLETMFSSDVAQVQALHKIMEQLMNRKQKAEEVVWELLMDVLFLRTGNGPAQVLAASSSTTTSSNGMHKTSLVTMSSAGSVVSNDSANKKNALNVSTNGTSATQDHHRQHLLSMNHRNPFLDSKTRFALDIDLQADLSANSNRNNDFDETEDDLFVDDGVDENNAEAQQRRKLDMVVPTGMMEAEFDLEGEERRSLEEQSYANANSSNGRSRSSSSKKKTRVTYLDHVLGLRTLVECLVRLRRLDDVERILVDALEQELPALVQREQARTFLDVEQSSSHIMGKKSGRYQMLLQKAGATTDLRDFRKHLAHMISAFGNVYLRLVHLAQIIRHRITVSEKHSAAYPVPSSALANVLQMAKDIMERELKEFLNASLHEASDPSGSEFNINMLTNVSGQTRQIANKTGNKYNTKSTKNRKANIHNRFETGLFSMGIIEKEDNSEENEVNAIANSWLSQSTSTQRSKIQNMSTPKFVNEVLFAKATQNGRPQIRHALFFRKSLAKWNMDRAAIRAQLASITKEDTSAPSHESGNEIPALEYLDKVIQRDLLPVLQEEAVNGTVQALERPDGFDPVLDRNVFAHTDSNQPQDVDMCHACTALYNYTGPLFLALHRLPKGGDMYLPLVAVLEHVILTFISRVKQQVSKLCDTKTALQLLLASTSGSKEKKTSFAQVMERRKAFAQLVLAYADGDMLEATVDEHGESGVPALAPSGGDTPRNADKSASLALAGMDDLDLIGGVEREEANLGLELQFVQKYLEFAGVDASNNIVTCTDEHLMKSACLAHSLLKLSCLLDSRLKVRSSMGVSTKTLTNTRALREAIKTIKVNGLRMAKFCRADVLLQSIVRLSKVCNSSTIVARDAVRIPSSVNDLGEYMTAASDNLREAAGNAVTAYAFSTLEQYIPLCLIQTVRVLAAGKGIVTKASLSMNGIEALDRSGSVLYRDLKGATSFENSFWDIELAAVSFERSASFIAMMELGMAELEAYYTENRNDFSEKDFELMFTMNGPRRKGQVNRYHMLVRKLNSKR